MKTFRDILFSIVQATGMVACSLLFFGIGWWGREATLAMPLTQTTEARQDTQAEDSGGAIDPCEQANPAGIAKASLGVYRVTAYCPCVRCCGKSDGITASGYQIQPGDKLCAAPREFPFGTILSIPGYGTVKVLDRGGAIKAKKLDVLFPTHQEALNWGVQYLEIRYANSDSL
jgi:3D (Asp-Asp-Asp) domain-containing protein